MKIHTLNTIKYILFSTFLLNSSHSKSQINMWNLDSCISYALRNNTAIQSIQIEIEIDKLNYNQAKSNFLPSISGFANHGYNWGQSIDPFTNKFATNQIRTNSFYVSNNLNLFTGFQRYYLLKQTLSNQLIENYNLDIEKRNLKIKITSIYLTSVSLRKQIELQKSNIQFLNDEKKIIEDLIIHQKVTTFDLNEINAEIHKQKACLTGLELDYKQNILNLKKLMHHPLDQELILNNEIKTNLLNNNFDFKNNLETKLNDEKIKNLESQLKQLNGKFFPTIYLINYIGTGYSGNNKEIINDVYTPKNFRNQLNDNFYQSLSINMSIPILNKLSNIKNIQLNKFELEKVKLNNEEIIYNIQSNFENLKSEIVSIEYQIESINKVINDLTKNFNISSEKYTMGLFNITQLLDSKKMLSDVENELNKLEFKRYFDLKILNYYTEN